MRLHYGKYSLHELDGYALAVARAEFVDVGRKCRRVGFECSHHNELVHALLFSEEEHRSLFTTLRHSRYPPLDSNKEGNLSPSTLDDVFHRLETQADELATTPPYGILLAPLQLSKTNDESDTIIIEEEPEEVCQVIPWVHCKPFGAPSHGAACLLNMMLDSYFPGVADTIYLGIYSGLRFECEFSDSESESSLSSQPQNDLSLPGLSHRRHQRPRKNDSSFGVLVKVFGMCQESGNFSMVMESFPNGSLDSLIADSSQSFTNGFYWLIARCAGMANLASQQVFHRDLAARNILLGSDMSPKVADFGYVRVVGEELTGQTKTTVGPTRWMSPESIQHSQFSEKTDVWAYACMLYELVAREVPFAGMQLHYVAVKVRILLETDMFELGRCRGPANRRSKDLPVVELHRSTEVRGNKKEELAFLKGFLIEVHPRCQSRFS